MEPSYSKREFLIDYVSGLFGGIGFILIGHPLE